MPWISLNIYWPLTCTTIVLATKVMNFHWFSKPLPLVFDHINEATYLKWTKSHRNTPSGTKLRFSNPNQEQSSKFVINTADAMRALFAENVKNTCSIIIVSKKIAILCAGVSRNSGRKRGRFSIITGTGWDPPSLLNRMWANVAEWTFAADSLMPEFTICTNLEEERWPRRFSS